MSEEHDAWSGLHDLEADLVVPDPAGEPVPDHVVFERAEHLVASFAALASVATGRPVRVVDGVSATRRLGGSPPTYRRLMSVVDTAKIAPPVPLPIDALAHPLDARSLRVIRWWARGISASDGVDRLIALTAALDHLSGAVEDAPHLTVTCQARGAKRSMRPGLKQKVLHLLRGLGYAEATASAIWESRNDIAHARSDLDERRPQTVSAARGLGRRGCPTLASADTLDIALPPTPIPLPVDLESMFGTMDFIGEPATDDPVPSARNE